MYQSWLSSFLIYIQQTCQKIERWTIIWNQLKKYPPTVIPAPFVIPAEAGIQRGKLQQVSKEDIFNYLLLKELVDKCFCLDSPEYSGNDIDEMDCKNK